MMKLVPLLSLSVFLLFGCATTPSLQDEIAGELDSYARLLTASGQPARGQEIAANAAQLREMQEWRRRQEQTAREGRPVEGSFWLGFEPNTVLRAYAADRRRLGETVEAERIDGLAASYEAEQRAQIERMLRP
jgi:hypothetical protein